ncbi:hypothetical protein BDZ91DRAFT_117050 [Kalaharituber pfeilii]|nr:hypothetical protein BDZ91DRAFT_117050 [Kalaharituber pfeilii]
MLIDTRLESDIKNGTGPAEAFFINEDTPVPELESGQVLVKVKAFGLNRMDLLQREGRYPVPPQAPKILGVEFSGIIEKVTPEVKDFKVGDEVFGLAYGGAYAEYIAVAAVMCILKPTELSWEIAAGIPEVWITAIQALFVVAEFKTGQSALIHAAASGVGIAAIQLIRHISPNSIIFATASTAAKLDFCISTLGATYGINYRETDFSREVLSKTEGKGVDIIIDFAGQSHFQKNLNCAAADAKIVLLALLSGGVVKEGVDIAPILFKRLRIEGSTLRSRNLEYQQILRDKLVDLALEGIRKGQLKVYIEKVFSWKDTTEAHKLIESNNTQGKVICLID